MAAVVTSRTKRIGSSMFLLLPKALLSEMSWRDRDTIAIRLCGEKLTAERVPLEKLAIIRTGEPSEVNP